MKNLYAVGGPMGVGKSAVCDRLKKKLPACVFLDGDWCWDSHPFTLNEHTKRMALQNIRFLLGQFVACPSFENIVFCWVLHDQDIIDTVLEGLEAQDCRITRVSLVCGPDTLRARLEGDVKRGIRTSDVIDRSLKKLPLYAALDTVKIDTDGRTADEIADEIAGM